MITIPALKVQDLILVVLSIELIIKLPVDKHFEMSNNKLMEETAQNQTSEKITPQTVETPVQVSTAPKKSFLSPVSIFIIIAVVLAAIGYAGYDYYVSHNVTNEPDINIRPVVKKTVSQKPLFLSIISPAEGDLISGNSVVVKGKTLPNATVSVIADKDTSFLDADTAGNFEGTITLGEGINTLNITAFSDNGEEKSIDVNLVYDKNNTL